MAYFEKCGKNEIFVGNIHTAALNKEVKTLTDNGINYRIGELAYDIHGRKLSPEQCLPLFINEKSYKKYDDMMMAELREIRRA